MSKFTNNIDREVEITSVLGEHSGKIYYQLINKIIGLNQEWNTYKVLFIDNEESVDLMNKVSSYVFYVFQKNLRNELVLNISRLTDPPQTGKHINISIPLLQRSLKENNFDLKTQEEIQLQMGWIINKLTPPLRELRNKIISHNDYETTLGNRSTQDKLTNDIFMHLIESINNLINSINFKHFNSKVHFDNDNIPGGANQLLAKLQVWDRVNSMNIERRKNGEEPII
jgi:hypothetical protein